MELFYSPQQAANIFDVDVRTIYKWIKNGNIKAFQPGGENSKFYIPRKEVERFSNI